MQGCARREAGIFHAVTKDRETLAKFDAPSIRYGAAFYKGNFYEDMELLGIPDEAGMEIVWKVTDAIREDLSINPSKNLLEYIDTAQKTWRSLIDEYLAKNEKAVAPGKTENVL